MRLVHYLLWNQNKKSWLRGQPLLGLTLGQLVLFGLLTRWVASHRLNSSDTAITHELSKKRPSLLRYSVFALSTIGGSPLLGFGSVPLAYVFWRKKKRLEASLTVAMTLLSTLARFLVRDLMQRPRPRTFFRRFHREGSKKSYPSGHVTTAVTSWGWFMILSLQKDQDTTPLQRWLLRISPPLLLLVGPTRIYLGDHWASDVLGGYIFGGMWLCLTWHLYRIFKKAS